MASFPDGREPTLPLPMGESVGQPPHAESLAFHKDRVTYQFMEVQAAVKMSCAPTPCQAGAVSLVSHSDQELS